MADCWIADKLLIVIHNAALTGKTPLVIEDRGLGLHAREIQRIGFFPVLFKAPTEAKLKETMS